MDLISKLEHEFAEYHGYKYGVAVNSGTSALTLAVRVSNIRDWQIPAFTMAATKWAVVYNHLEYKEIDCDDSLNINPELINKGGGIIITDIYGRMAYKAAKRARELGLFIIEDACEAHGAKPYGDIVCYSFYKNKIVHAEEGGICLTNDKELADKMRWLKCMSFGKGKYKYKHDEIGFNFRMPENQSILAYNSFKEIEKNLQTRREIEEKLNEIFPKEMRMPKRDVVWVYDVKGRYEDFEELGIRPFFYSELPNAKKWFNQGFYININEKLCSTKWQETLKKMGLI